MGARGTGRLDQTRAACPHQASLVPPGTGHPGLAWASGERASDQGVTDNRTDRQSLAHPGDRTGVCGPEGELETPRSHRLVVMCMRLNICMVLCVCVIVSVCVELWLHVCVCIS